MFSSSTAFEPETSYSKFGAYALLDHGGDFKRAALALSQQGYGEQGEAPPRPRPAAADRAPDPPTAPDGFARPLVTEGLGDCVLRPRLAQPYSGWFMRGGVHLVAGSSGAGKSTLMLDVLEQQARGGLYLGHVGNRLDYLVIFADRGKVSNDETLERMRIVPDRVPMAHIPPNAHGRGSQSRPFCAPLRCKPICRRVVFIEGADMLVDDPSKPQIVALFMGALRRIAEHYNLALILSVGAPKAKPHEQYALARDRVFGSQMWGRLANDVLVLSITGDGTVPTRDLVVLHRNAAAEKFSLAFDRGRLVEADAPPASDRDFVTWFAEQELFTKHRFREQFSISGDRATQLLDGYAAIGVLRAKVRNDRTHYVFKRSSAAGATTSAVSGPVPLPDTFPPRDADAESVRTAHRTGHENSEPKYEFPNVSEPSRGDSLIPLKTLSGVRLDVSAHAQPDTGQPYEGYTHARENGGALDELPELADVMTDLKAAFGPGTVVTVLPESLPAWVTDADAPLAADDPEAPFADRDEERERLR